MNFNRIICYLLFAIFIIYNSYVAYFASGSIITQGSVVLILIISFIYFLKTLMLKNNKGMFFIAWSVLLFLNIFSFLLTAEYSNKQHYGMFLSILLTMFSFYPFYYFARKGILKRNHLIMFFMLMIPISILSFYTAQLQVLSERTTGNTDVVNNIAYTFVRLMPFAFLIKNRNLSVILMSLLMFFVIQGAKRGAILVGFVVLLIYFYYLLNTIENRNRLKGYLITSFSIIILSVVVLKYLQSNDFLIQRILLLTQGSSSGRDVIYTKILDAWLYSENIYNWFIGYGFAASLKITGGLYAHNDWLELLSNFGIIGIIIYLTLMYSAYKLSNKRQWNLDKKILMKVLIFTWFLTSAFSMWYTNTQGYTQAILLAYLVGSSGKEGYIE